MSRVLVTLHRVHKAYGAVVALNDLSLEIHEKEFVTLLGPSGSGKTTTLMLIAGFEQPTRGEIRIRGESVVARPPERRDIGMVFQSYALFPHMTVFENVAFPLRTRQDRRGRGRVDASARRSTWCGCAAWATAIHGSSPAASSSAWPWPGPSSTVRRCC